MGNVGINYYVKKPSKFGRALRPEYADSLLENLQKIAKGVDESLDKVGWAKEWL
jgi:hypothetical protein